MTKRQQRARMREVQKELLERVRKRFPRVELIETEERPGGTFVLHLYAPYKDMLFAILDCTSPRVVELIDEGLDVMVLPHRQKPARRAA